MGIRYEREFWHYGTSADGKPYACRFIVERDTRAGYRSFGSITFYYEFKDGSTHLWTPRDLAKRETYEKLLYRSEGRAAHRGMFLNVDEEEKLFYFVLDSIANMGRVAPRKDEIIND